MTMNSDPHGHLSLDERNALRKIRRLIVYQGHQHTVWCDGQTHWKTSWDWEGEVGQERCWCKDLGGPGWNGIL